MKNTIKNPLKRSIVLGCILFVLMLCLVLGIMNYFSYRSSFYERYEAYIGNILNYTASQTDVDDLERCMETGVESEKFRRLQALLDGIKEHVELDFLYIIVPLNAGETDNIRNVIAGVTAYEYEFESDTLMHLNELSGDSYSPSTAQKYLDAYASGSLSFFEEIAEWGDEYTGLLPLYDSAGNKVAALCVDVNIDEINTGLARELTFIVLITVALGALFIAVFLLWAGKNITKPIMGLEQAVTEFAGMSHRERDPAKLKLTVPRLETGNEVDALSRAVGKMGEDIRSFAENLVSAEKEKERTNAMITALSADYHCVYYVVLDTDEGVCYRTDHTFRNAVPAGGLFRFQEVFSAYANNYVTEKYREGFLRFIDPAHIREALESELVISYRYLVSRDGEDTYEMLRMAGVRRPEDRDDHIVHAVGVGFSDIDSEMRETMAQSSALRDALDAAENANHAKTVFLSNMSHEIRTPMNAIIGLDAIAMHDPEVSEKAKEYLGKIGGSAQHLLGIINEILDMSRVESGHMAIRQEAFSFSGLLEQINAIISGQCREKDLRYDCNIKGTLEGQYIGDDQKLRQILLNILGNAVKFTPAGGEVRFTVEETAKLERNVTLRFTVTDTGIGMSKEYLPKLFDTFSQEDATAANKSGSTGLGMSITKSLVELMNGSIDVESEKGVGSRFTVTVSLLEAEHGQTGQQETDFRPDEITALVIDDDPIAREHAKLTMEQLGIDCDMASSGAEAVRMVELRQARRTPCDLILVDWKMPDQDGISTTQQIRAIAGDGVRILVATAYNWDDIAEEARNAGVDGFVPKPLFADTLAQAIREVWKKEKKSERKKADLTNRRILVAEDIDINAEIVLMLLEEREMQGERAENGKIAVEMFRRSPMGYYDAVLMDMRMPEMNGLEATAAIRAMDRPDAGTIPIIALTANAFDDDVQRSMQAGLNAHLSKPVDPEVLFETLEAMIAP